MQKKILITVFALLIFLQVFAQQFEAMPNDIFSKKDPLLFGHILCTSKGSVLVANSLGISEIDHSEIELVTATSSLSDDKGNKTFLGKNSNIFKDQYDSLSGMKLIYEGPDKIIY